LGAFSTRRRKVLTKKGSWGRGLRTGASGEDGRSICPYDRQQVCIGAFLDVSDSADLQDRQAVTPEQPVLLGSRRPRGPTAAVPALLSRATGDEGGDGDGVAATVRVQLGRGEQRLPGPGGPRVEQDGLALEEPR